MVDEVFEEKQDICSGKSTRQKVAAAAVAVKVMFRLRLGHRKVSHDRVCRLRYRFVRHRVSREESLWRVQLSYSSGEK